MSGLGCRVFVDVCFVGLVPVQPEAFTDSEAMTVITFLAYPLVPVAIGFAIQRYRLYDIDRVVSRTVSYAVITAMLARVYVGCVALLTNVLPFSSEARIATSVRVAVALFVPLRRRVQREVDRRFNQARYDAERVIAAFTQRRREQADIDAVRTEGAFSYWKSAFLGELSDTALEIMVEAVHRCPSAMSGLGIVPYLGAVTRVGATATAFAYPVPVYSLLIVSQWQDPQENDPNIAWARETFEELRPYMGRRRYINNVPADDAGIVRQVWGANYERLVRIKGRYDPGNMFRLNHNIDPSGQAG